MSSLCLICSSRAERFAWTVKGPHAFGLVNVCLACARKSWDTPSRYFAPFEHAPIMLEEFEWGAGDATSLRSVVN